MISNAIFSPCRTYRYVLTRRWSSTLPEDQAYCAFVMLNPSTADEVKNDPTVERCQRRAKQWGLDGLCVLNLFAYRSTDPRELYDQEDPIGPDNDANIINYALQCPLVICGWGNHGALLDRGQQVLNLLHENGIVPHALALNGDGSPRHPLYVPYSRMPAPMRKRA